VFLRRLTTGRAWVERRPTLWSDMDQEERKAHWNDNLGEVRICRNCHDSEGDDFIAPCQCSGSIRWVHRHCLDEWRSVSRNPSSFTQCDVRSRRTMRSNKRRCWLRASIQIGVSLLLCIQGAPWGPEALAQDQSGSVHHERHSNIWFHLPDTRLAMCSYNGNRLSSIIIIMQVNYMAGMCLHIVDH